MNEVELIEKALKLEPGGSYVLELDHHLTDKQLQQLRSMAEDVAQPIGVNFVVLPPGVRLVKDTECAA